MLPHLLMENIMWGQRPRPDRRQPVKLSRQRRWSSSYDPGVI